MSTSQPTTTLVGRVGTDPRFFSTEGRQAYTSFRVATSKRYRDQADGQWKETATRWFTVKSFGATAEHVARSVRKGEPVVVFGRVLQQEWEASDGRRADLVVEADAIGHDLTYGSSHFLRTRPSDARTAASGTPVDVTDLAELDDELEDPPAGEIGDDVLGALEPSDGPAPVEQELVGAGGGRRPGRR